MCNWSDDLSMQFNADKCKVMHLGTRNQKYSYAMNGFAPVRTVLEPTEEDVDLLEDVQKRVIRMTSGLSYGTYVEKLAEVGLTTLEERRPRWDIIQTWKILHGPTPSPSGWFTPVTPCRTLVKESATLNSFKNSCDRHVIPSS